MSPVVEAMVKSNPDTRFIFKEFPIFSSRWPVSGLAARIGEQVWLNDGGAKYLAWHNALYATGKVEGQLTEQDVYALASHYLTQPQIRAVKTAQQSGAVHDALLSNQALAQHMNFPEPRFCGDAAGSGSGCRAYLGSAGQHVAGCVADGNSES